MTDDIWLTETQQRVWRDWLNVQARLLAALNRQLQNDHDMSLQDFEVLVQLSEAPEEKLRLTALAEALRWEQSRLSHHLTRMTKRDLVVREPCPEDARGSFACLTATGRARLEAAAPSHAATVRALLFDPLGTADLQRISTATQAILTALERAEATD
ncbi:MarR family winged helix-turn-helix transcriptional regulator [Granulicoccus sp. GXG6511]|uniref:MarR family winged helix-turn-helix transcriptional regulator n=1 Tax=Granulicoccus sp. GXG6511 TaxID=3381351 RepID=UPI003D7C9007